MSLEAWLVVMREVPEWWALSEKRGPRGVSLHRAMIECGFDMPELVCGYEILERDVLETGADD